MFDDTVWEDSDLQGFRFNWDQSEKALDVTHFTPSWTNINEAKLLEQEAINADVERILCSVCHKVIENSVLYEKEVSFCSEPCWQSVLYTAMDDFSLGGMSAWPLDTFGSYASKSFLLGLATRSLDGTIIVKMLRHFQMSLSKATFERLLLANRVAFDHFVNFLRKTGQTQLLQDLLAAQNLVEHAKIYSYNQLIQQLDSVNMANAENLIHRLNVFALSELTNNPKLNLLRQATLDLSELLRFQFENQPEWTAFCDSLKAVGAAMELGDSASADLLALPLSETIRACSWMDKSLGPGSRANELRTHHNVSDEQFHWYIVEPLVMGSRWAEMDSALLEKKWLKRRVETRLPTDRLVLYLHALNAPPQIISTYLSHSENNEELIETATRLRMYSVAIQACVRRKDRVALQELLHRIPKKRPEHAEVVYYLSTPVNQWKDGRKS
ncbi:hypothetical protein CRM22_005358 [Opisthorchis felineus]|uniref:Vps16 C-terminal domain-containing protein n=1 Tax=Opisthorchis felineus TaxID=147828 RepID=A0A4S2LRL2_OPIFE|nr:hypothetical protein CRM22_005358 [Opisthorchis felineus]